MRNNKSDLIQFLVWMRNGVSFCTTWLLILWMLLNFFYGIEVVKTESVLKMLLFVLGGVFLFSSAFTKFLIKRWSFVTRLTCFMILFSIYECVAFLSMGFWKTSGSMGEWIGFCGIVFSLYIICVAIYRVYSRKQGEMYTKALQNYQYMRSVNHEK